jgi:hypothetical protein
LAKRGSHQVYNTIPWSKEWLIVNCVVNATRKALPRLYTFQKYWLPEYYIKLCKARSCMVMQTKAWMTSFLFKEWLSFFKKLVPCGIFQTWVSCDTRGNYTSKRIWLGHGHSTFINIACFLALRCGLLQAFQNCFHERKRCNHG